ncbi:MAG: hypothetical protein ACFCGT_09945 [Sandaracinaceae bacterium]
MALLGLVGCQATIPEGVFFCEDSGDCPPGQECDLSDNRCRTFDAGQIVGSPDEGVVPDQGALENTEPLCRDGEDNDGDGVGDCDDPDCCPTRDDCPPTTLCGGTCPAGPEDSAVACQDGCDNDEDGLEDCEDPDCRPFCPCPEVRDRPVEQAPALIRGEVRWTCFANIELAGPTVVEPGATLVIGPGTRVLGLPAATPTALLLVQPGGRLIAVGTPDDPVVFSSAAPPGGRRPGDWVGLFLLGNAPVNTPGGGSFIEGFPTPQTGRYGGSERTGSCGELEHVRVEFGGNSGEGGGVAGSGITLGGCGSSTRLSQIHVHRIAEDGIEFFGGSANADHLIITRVQDDAHDYSLGWTGAVQYLAVQAGPTTDNGVEGDNLDGSVNATPRSNPTIWNATLIGGTAATNGMLLRRGTGGDFGKVLIDGWGSACVAVRTDTDTLVRTGVLTLSSSLLHGCTEEIASSQADNTFRLPEAGNRFGVDPGLPPAVRDPVPDWRAPAGSALTENTPPPAPLDPTGYLGAFEPGASPTWADWTQYPPN